MENYFIDDLILFLMVALGMLIIFLVFYAIDRFTTNRILKKSRLENHIYYTVKFNSNKKDKLN